MKSVLGDLVLSLKSSFFPTAKLRYWFEFKKEMLIFCGQWSFNSLIQCYRKGNFWKILWETSFFYSKRHSVPFHILRGSTTNHKFCFNVVAIQYLSSPTISRNDFARSVFVLFKNTLRVVFESKREHTRKSRLAPLQQSV